MSWPTGSTSLPRAWPTPAPASLSTTAQVPIWPQIPMEFSRASRRGHRPPAALSPRDRRRLLFCRKPQEPPSQPPTCPRPCLSRCHRLTPTVLLITHRAWGCSISSRCLTTCPRMPGRTTCFALTPRKAAASRSATLRTPSTSTARTRAARLCSGLRRGCGSTGRTTSSRTRSARPSLPRSTPRSPAQRLGVPPPASTEGKRFTSIAKL